MTDFVPGAALAVAVEVAAVNVVLGMMVAWGLSGGDGEPPNVLTPLLGIGAFIGTLATLAVSLPLLKAPGVYVMALVLLATAVFLFWGFSTYESERLRRLFLVIAAIAALAAAAAVGLGGWAEPPTPRHLLIAATPAVLTVLAVPFTPSEGGGRRSIAGVLALPALLLVLAAAGADR